VSDPFPYVEQSLTASLGISREELRRLREQLVDGKDWILKKRRVRLSQSGFDKLRALLSLPAVTAGPDAQTTTATPEEPAEKKAAPGAVAEDGVVVLYVWQTVTNPKIVEGYLPGTDPTVRANILRVRVRDSRNFVRMSREKPMEMKCRHLQTDLYELATACPRKKGVY
jgi:hypothetical protein